MGRPTWRDALAVHRLELPFPILYLCYAAWGVCYAADDVRGLLTAPAVAAIVANLLLALAGLALNSAVDIRTDAHHPERGHLADGALRFGRSRVLRCVAAEMSVAMLLTIVVSTWSGRWQVAAAAAAIIALQLLYNVEPVRLKRRGFAGVVVFCAGVVVLPGVLSYYAVGHAPDWPVWLVFVGAGVLAVGRMTWWSLPDRTADATTGMATPSVRYGAVGALTLSCLIMLAGLVLLGGGLWWGFGPLWACVGTAAHVVFLVGACHLLRGMSHQSLPSSARMRRRDLPVVMFGEAAIAAIPLLAS